MVEQAEASLPGSLTAERHSYRRAPVGVATVAHVEPALTAPRLLAVVVVALLIPGSFSLGGLQLSPNRLLLLGLVPYLGWGWLNGVAGRPTASDVLMLIGTGWIGLALTVNNGFGFLPRGVILMVELFGGYLIGRMLIRHTGDYRFFFRVLTWGFAILLPFALVEMATGKNLIRPIFGHLLSIPPRQSNLGMRLGLVRSQTVFEHPILFGIVGSMAVSNMLYIYRDNFMKSLRMSGFFFFMVFTTISSGPMISVGIQLCLTLWDRVLRFLSFRWFLLASFGLLGLVAIRFASEFHLLDFVIQNFMFNPNTADGRLVILEYGSAEIIRHPIFGIGASDWVRPFYKKPSVDNFWLGHAMRYGLPSFLMIATAIGLNFARISAQPMRSKKERDYRTGYLITLVGVVVTLGTVYIWSATSVFVMLFIGAGAMFYVRVETEDDLDATSRTRRAAQAQAFGSAPAAKAAGPGTPAAAAARAAAAPAPERSFSRRAGTGAIRGRIGPGGGTLPGPAAEAERQSGDDRHA